MQVTASSKVSKRRHFRPVQNAMPPFQTKTGPAAFLSVLGAWKLKNNVDGRRNHSNSYAIYN